MKLFYVLLWLLLTAIVIKYNLPPEPQYKAGECSKDQIHEDTRKVEEVLPYIYKYCLIVDNECNRKFSMRITDFDRIMIKVKCPE